MSLSGIRGEKGASRYSKPWWQFSRKFPFAKIKDQPRMTAIGQRRDEGAGCASDSYLSEADVPVTASASGLTAGDGRNKAIIKPKNKYFPVSAFIWNSLCFLFLNLCGRYPMFAGDYNLIPVTINFAHFLFTFMFSIVCAPFKKSVHHLFISSKKTICFA